MNINMNINKHTKFHQNRRRSCKFLIDLIWNCPTNQSDGFCCRMCFLFLGCTGNKCTGSECSGLRYITVIFTTMVLLNLGELINSFNRLNRVHYCHAHNRSLKSSMDSLHELDKSISKVRTDHPNAFLGW